MGFKSQGLLESRCAWFALAHLKPTFWLSTVHGFNLFYLMIWPTNCSDMFIPTFSLRAQIENTRTAAPNNLWRLPSPSLSSSCIRREFLQKLPSLPACFCSRCAFAVTRSNLSNTNYFSWLSQRLRDVKTSVDLLPSSETHVLWNRKIYDLLKTQVSGFRNIYLRFQDERPCEYKWQYMLEILSLW